MKDYDLNNKPANFTSQNGDSEPNNRNSELINKFSSFKDIQEKSNTVTISPGIDIENITYIPTVFISYSYDNDQHLEWVKKFAEDLITRGGINTILDQWELNYGDSVSKFMENIHSVDKIIIVCSPLYKEKADNVKDGVGYEKKMIVEKLKEGEVSTIIPVCPFKREDSTPFFLSDIYVAVFTNENYDEIFLELVRNIYGKSRMEKPQLGEFPNFII